MSNWRIILLFIIIPACKSAKHSGKNNQPISYNEQQSLNKGRNVTAGIPAYGATTINYSRSGNSILNIQLQEPVVVAVATKPEKWGFFQFPSIAQMNDNNLNIKWKLNADAMEAYGEHNFGSAISKDGGRSWESTNRTEPAGTLLLQNGDRIGIHTPKPIKQEELQLSNPIGTGEDTYSRSAYTFYKLDQLPESRQGIFIERLPKGSTEWKVEKASLNDPLAARYTLRGQMPIVWWGDLQQLKDGSIIAGVYPGFLIMPNGLVDPRSGVFFYKSVDNGHSWKIHGRIPYVADLTIDSSGNKRMGFTEPAFVVLNDGTFICVIRTTDGVGNGPMYISRSTDQGVNWTKPEVMTPSGVLPQLLQLQNGAVVLASGRPGVQLRFSIDGKGVSWTDPFEMMPFKDYSDQVSCGYTGLLLTGPDRFLIVYSDFRFLNEAKEIRKAIKVREVIVTPK